MSGVFERWRGRPAHTEPAIPEPPTPPGVGLQLWLDAQARVLRLSGPLRTALALPRQQNARLQDYVQPASLLVLEGEPADWQAQPLDLDMRAAGGLTLHTRGWLLAHGDGWLLQLFDIGDLLQQRRHGEHAERQQHLCADLATALRDCSEDHLPQICGEQLQRLAWHWHAPWTALLLQGPGGWHTFAHSEAELPWADDARLSALLDGLPAEHALGSRDHRALHELFMASPVVLLPYAQQHEVKAWLLCAEPALPLDGDAALPLVAALAEPLLGRLAGVSLHANLQRLDGIQGLLGAGWWEWALHEPFLHLAPGLAISLGVPSQLSLAAWQALLHPADREAAQLAFNGLHRAGGELQLSVRLLTPNARWYRLCGQVRGEGHQRRLSGFMLDINDIKQQQQQASAAHARLDNLIASSPAVIYIQRYDAGALHAEFFSASLQPLLGWEPEPEALLQPSDWVHPDDQSLWLERTRLLLREGQVRSRYRLRDALGGYHWVLDEARLLRDDLGLPVEVVGLWLDVTEATQAAERIRQSEERYRVLVEDSPAMICRYRPDLRLVFGNRPLADYLECEPEQLAGLNLGEWMSESQRQAFLARMADLNPAHPVSTAEICLELPGRAFAWWVWSDRGLFDEQGTLVEVQAVGRDNTAVRLSQQQLLQSAKMATLGEMATGMAHELNQPLNVMRMAVANTLKRLENGEVEVSYLQEKLARIDAQVQRASKVIEHMRVFGRRSEIEQQLFDPWRAVEGAQSLLADGLQGKGIELRLGAAPEVAWVRGHQDQLEQVLINLLVNARDALLARREREPGLQPWVAVRLTADDERVRLWVEDNAGGIDPRLLERIFEPFFTTKPSGVGTGLGLSVSYGIVQNMRGQLSASNTVEGACFCIGLPLAAAL